jgi:hypothetical protein
MSRTSRKLTEAQFFLRKLEDAVTEHPDFDHFFSAFVSSARSVTWVMKAEYKDCPGWLAWYEEKKPDEAEHVLLSQMNKLRVRSEKFEPLETRVAIVMDFPPEAVTPELREFLDTGVGQRFRTWIYKVPEEGPATIPEGIPEGASVFTGAFQGIVRHVPELTDQDVVSACQAYVATLELLVGEAEAIAGAA